MTPKSGISERADAIALARSLNDNTGSPRYVIYNRGTITNPPQTSKSFLIYNTSAGTINYTLSPVTQQPAPIKQKVEPAPTVYACKLCKDTFITEKECRDHARRFPKFCPAHKICVTSWREHVRKRTHRKCPVPKCHREGSDLGDNENFMGHFRRNHD